MNLSLISNIVLEPHIRKCLKVALSADCDTIELKYIPYENYETEKGVLKEADIVAVMLDFDCLYPDCFNKIKSGELKPENIKEDSLSRCKELYSFINGNASAQLVWFGFDDYCYRFSSVFGNSHFCGGLVDEINITLQRELSGECSYIDLKRLIAKVGINSAYDIKNKYRWNAPYSLQIIEQICSEIYKQYQIHHGKNKKCLVVDCDNVLWGGILSEDGINGISIGQLGLSRQYHDFQSFLLTLYYHGVIIAVCSKNDEADVLRVFAEHSGMLLKTEHIACFECSWQDKPSGVRNIADKLNIGIDSMVFVDDSIFEIESVKFALPEVKAILYDRNTIYDELSCFNLNIGADITTVQKRNETYKSNVKRAELKEKSGTYEEYLGSLEMEIDIHEAKLHEMMRLAELTQRTNKCTNGARYTHEELQDLSHQPDYALYTICVKDKFSDLGIVGTIGIHGQVLDLFSLSCRALGRGIENKMLEYVNSKHSIRHVNFTSTKYNKELDELLVDTYH